MAGRPAVIVLAAGRGSRFAGAGHKLEQSLGTGTVLGHALQSALASQLPLVVVTTAAFEPLARQSVAARDVIVVPEANVETRKPSRGLQLGMGYSIAAGVAARPDADGWLILPGDMPRVQPRTLLAVARQLDDGAVVAYAQHRGRRGHPVGFAAELYSELVMLQGDEGARRLVARYPAIGVDVDDAGVLVDVDTAADLIAIRQAVGAAPPVA